ncbi:MAG: UDP-N-acetylglucosamine diphosphorylase [Clostridiales Family XIII bacterium]|jgi:bifunctional UDP-N-acetylglucosamine pyrophosphorylase/glucosamine-1-phosphate N-acetyltransferase|nr:UDP-N-acetylglucosamine diphosphorylase [Clostridiales Family XIII bacterium]
MEILEEYEAQERERLRINARLAGGGVLFDDIKTAYIGGNVRIGAGTQIGPCVTIEGDAVIGGHCRIGQNTRISDSRVGDGAVIEQSVIIESEIGDGASVGPFAYMRPGSRAGDGTKVGDFVEMKNSVLGNGSKASHLTYIGDSDIGENVNLGCGVVFVNYDGKEKHRSAVGDGAFIGCNVNVISPVTVGDGAYVAAGTTVTADVPEGSLSVGRVKQRIIQGWVKRRGLLKERRDEK